MAAPPSHFDVIIVGGGIAGATLGAEISGKARTIIIEAESQCGYHSTGRSAAFWLESYGGPVVAELTSASRRFLEEGGYLFPRGALHVSPDPDIELPAEVEGHAVARD